MRELQTLFDSAEQKLSEKELAEYYKNTAKVLGLPAASLKVQGDQAKSEIILSEFERASGHSVANLLRDASISDKLTYKSIVADCCDFLEIPKGKKNLEQLEKALVERLTRDFWEDLEKNHPQKIAGLKRKILKELEANDEFELAKNFAKTAAPFAVLLAANAGGFGLYVAATSALAAISGGLGVGLSFAAYAGLAEAISVAIGPGGWIIAGVYAVYKLGKPSYAAKIIPCVVLFARLRADLDIKSKRSRTLRKPKKQPAKKLTKKPVKKKKGKTRA